MQMGLVFCDANIDGGFHGEVVGFAHQVSKASGLKGRLSQAAEISFGSCAPRLIDEIPVLSRICALKPPPSMGIEVRRRAKGNCAVKGIGFAVAVHGRELYASMGAQEGGRARGPG